MPSSGAEPNELQILIPGGAFNILPNQQNRTNLAHQFVAKHQRARMQSDAREANPKPTNTHTQ
jgi:hypothetical protein